MMRTILAACNREILWQYAASSVLLAFDYDGTLAPIVDNRAHAPMRARTRALLGKLCHRFRCAVISGRARQDVSRYLRSLAMFAVVGNHGMEPGPIAARPSSRCSDGEATCGRVWRTTPAFSSRTNACRSVSLPPRNAEETGVGSNLGRCPRAPVGETDRRRTW